MAQHSVLKLRRALFEVGANRFDLIRRANQFSLQPRLEREARAFVGKPAFLEQRFTAADRVR